LVGNDQRLTVEQADGQFARAGRRLDVEFHVLQLGGEEVPHHVEYRVVLRQVVVTLRDVADRVAQLGGRPQRVFLDRVLGLDDGDRPGAAATAGADHALDVVDRDAQVFLEQADHLLGRVEHGRPGRRVPNLLDVHVRDPLGVVREQIGFIADRAGATGGWYGR